MIPLEVIVAAIVSVVGTVAAAGAKGIWTWGREVAREREDKVFWRDIALRAAGLTDKAIDVAVKKSRAG